MKIKNRSFKKKVSAVVAMLSAVAIMLSGTFTWYQTQKVINEFAGISTNKNVVTHDDFDSETGDKQVYIENTSEKTAIFVRVRLDEVMDLTRSIKPSPINWTTHIPDSEVENCEFANAVGKEFHDYFTWEMGGQKWYMPSALQSSGVVQDTINYEGTLGAKQTPLAEVITMDQYKDLPQKDDFKGWVYDVDGYAYWSQPIEAGEATGLLLNKVITNNIIKGTDYYYAINVGMEAVDYADLGMWTIPSGYNDGKGQPSIEDGSITNLATDNARDLLNSIAGGSAPTIDPSEKVAAITIKAQPTKTTYIAGESFDKTGMSIEVTYADSENHKETITSGFTYHPTGALPAGTTEITISYAGATAKVPIKVTTALLPEMIEKGITGTVEDEGKTFKVDGIEWQIVKKADGTNNFLIVAKYTQSDATTGTTTYYMDDDRKWNTYENSDLSPKMETWYKLKCAKLAQFAMKPNLPIEKAYLLSAKDNSALSSATEFANGETSNIVFPLSISELNIYDGKNGFTRKAPLGEADGAFGYYATRSPGHATEGLIYSDKWTAYCDTGGVIFQWNHTKPTEKNHWMRPAMWINIPEQQ